MIEIRGTTALVTGAAKRLGRAIALALAREGVNIIVHYHTSKREAEVTADDIRSHGVNAWTIQADLGSLEQAETVIPQAREYAGAIDILVNSASIFPQNRVTDFSGDDFRQNMYTNALSPLWFSRAFAEQKRPGVIINLLDTRMLDYDHAHAAYHLSKRTLYTLTKMLSIEFAPNIRVNGVAPGLILPPPDQDEIYLAQLKHTNPLQRVGTADDVAAAVLFLIRSDFITGQVIYVDGGRHLRGHFYGA